MSTAVTAGGRPLHEALKSGTVWYRFPIETGHLVPFFGVWQMVLKMAIRGILELKKREKQPFSCSTVLPKSLSPPPPALLLKTVARARVAQCLA